MKHASLNFIITGLLAAGGSAFGFDGYPQADKLEPRIAKVGTVLTITGSALAKERVEEVFLTDHRFDMKVKVLEQSETTLKIRIPPFAKPGRLQLLFLTSGDKPAYLEQPLYVQVEEGEAEPATPAAPPVEVTKKATNTVEVASIGKSIPVPQANAVPAASSTAAPPPASGASKAAPVVTAAVQPAPVVKREEAPAANTQAPTVPVPVPPAPVQQPAPQQQTPAPAEPQAAPAARSVTPPRLIKRTPVSMPANTAAMGSDTTVELQLHIRTDGRVGNVKVIRGNPLFVQAATRSVRDWVYESAYVGSTPVETDITVILNFKR